MEPGFSGVEAASEKTGVMIVRVWREVDAPSGIRARIVQTLDIADPSESLAAASSAEEICAAVHEWLDRFCGQNP